MDRILEKDENVQKEISTRAQFHLDAHNYYRQLMITKHKNKYIVDKSYEQFEKKIFEELTEESKEKDPYIRFIKERIEKVYLNPHLKILNDDIILSMNKLYPHFRRWFEKNFPTIPVHSYAKARSNFLIKIGPFTSIEGWKTCRLRSLV